MKQLIPFICLSCLLFAPPVEAATIPETLAHCRAKDKDTERLACYDELARAVAEGVALPPLSDSDIGQWQVSQETSPVDDSRNVYIAILNHSQDDPQIDADRRRIVETGRSASRTVQIIPDCYMTLKAENMVDVSGLGSLGLTRPTLVVRCKEGETNVFINYGSSLELFEDRILVLTRFDKQPAQENRWPLSTDREAIFAPENVFWARKIADSRKLFVRFTPTRESPVSATFQLKGSAEAMRPLREACGF